MGVALHVGDRRYEVGASDFLNAFFSTIVMRLEAGKWGNRYPTVMNKLYMGEVEVVDLIKLREELAQVREELKRFSPGAVVWDFEDPSKLPPWGSAINEGIRTLSDYFWTADGKQLFDVMFAAIERAALVRESLVIA
jgi:hypothetical protein